MIKCVSRYLEHWGASGINKALRGLAQAQTKASPPLRHPVLCYLFLEVPQASASQASHSARQESLKPIRGNDWYMGHLQPVGWSLVHIQPSKGLARLACSSLCSRAQWHPIYLFIFLQRSLIWYDVRLSFLSEAASGLILTSCCSPN